MATGWSISSEPQTHRFTPFISSTHSPVMQSSVLSHWNPTKFMRIFWRWFSAAHEGPWRRRKRKDSLAPNAFNKFAPLHWNCTTVLLIIHHWKTGQQVGLNVNLSFYSSSKDAEALKNDPMYFTCWWKMDAFRLLARIFIVLFGRERNQTWVQVSATIVIQFHSSLAG